MWTTLRKKNILRRLKSARELQNKRITAHLKVRPFKAAPSGVVENVRKGSRLGDVTYRELGDVRYREVVGAVDAGHEPVWVGRGAGG